jgi:hypothetical protein
MSEHTDWKTAPARKQSNFGRWQAVVAARDEVGPFTLARVNGGNGASGDTEERTNAHARLIAAAPDLLAELRSTLIALPNHSPDCRGQSVAGAACCFFAERHRNARAAIAKAEVR